MWIRNEIAELNTRTECHIYGQENLPLMVLANILLALEFPSNFGQENQSPPAFRRTLKTSLFAISFPAD